MRARLTITLCLMLVACAKPAPRQVVVREAPQAPQVRIGQAGGTAFVPTVTGVGTVAPRKIPPALRGEPVVAEARSFVLHLALPAGDVARITLGATAQVTFAAFDDDTLVGRVIAIGGGQPVTISLPIDARLHAGQTGTARIAMTGAATPVLAVPPGALFARQGLQAQIYVVDLATSRVHLRHVTLGAENTAGIDVTSGLKLGEWVALTRPDTLREGMQIEPLGPDS